MKIDTYTVLATCQIEDPDWAHNPTGTKVEAALSMALLDATWESLESQLRIQILAETWPYLTRSASIQVDDDKTPCPEELFDSLLTFAKDQYTQRIWKAIGGVLSRQLTSLHPGHFSTGSSFKIKKLFPQEQSFTMPVGPIVIPQRNAQQGGMIPQTEVTLEGALCEDIEVAFTI